MKEEILLKLIEKLLESEKEPTLKSDGNPQNDHELKGKMVIVRARDAGVHFGELVSVSGRTVVLNKARRMYRWWSAKEMTLSAVAEHGLNLEKDLKICCEIDNHNILDACEVMPCSSACIDSFSKVDNYNEQ